MMSQFDFLLQGLLEEIWGQLSGGLDSSARYVPAWRYELEWRLHVVVTCPSIQASYLLRLNKFQATLPTGANIALEELPVEEMIRYGLSRPVLTDGQIARLALSGETLVAFREVYLHASNDSIGEIWHRAAGITSPEYASEPAPDSLLPNLRKILQEED